MSKPERNLKTAMDRRLSGLEAQERHIRFVMEQATQKRSRVKPRTLILAFVLMAVLGTALAIGLPTTISWIQQSFGDKKAGQLSEGTLMPGSQTTVLGEVRYELLETIHVGDTGSHRMLGDSNALYGTIRITPVAGANIVLIPEDFEITLPAGYHVFMGEQAPQDAPSYLDLAMQKDAKIVLAKAVPHGIWLNGELQEGYEIMYSFRSNLDGSLYYHFEIPMVLEDDAYTIQLRLNNWEVTREGVWLRGSSQEGEHLADTWLKEDWVVTVRPCKE